MLSNISAAFVWHEVFFSHPIDPEVVIEEEHMIHTVA
jgi:hypothetical protein